VSTPPDLSLIVLAFNEEESIEGFVRECLAWFDGCPGNHDIVVVDDGSSDATRERAGSTGDKRVQVVTHETNRGMGAGMRTGIRNAKGTHFAVLAGDGQIPASSLDTLLPALSGADIVLSTYTRRHSERYRVLLSKGLRTLMRWALGVNFELEGTYLFPVSIARDDIGVDNVGAETFFFSFELIARAVARGHSTAQVVIEPRARAHGESKVANWSRIRRVGTEVLRFRKRLRTEARSR